MVSWADAAVTFTAVSLVVVWIQSNEAIFLHKLIDTYTTVAQNIEYA
jgi:hypothetical protein